MICYCILCKQPFNSYKSNTKYCKNRECQLERFRQTTRRYRDNHRNNPNWKARLNRRIYFNQQIYRFGTSREEILRRFDNHCAYCPSTLRLQIHHINGKGRNSTKPDNRIENLTVLCQKCHRKIEIFKKTLQKYICIYPKSLIGIE